MEITTRMSGHVAVVKLKGKLTADDGGAAFTDAVHALIESGHTQIVLECVDLLYADHVGMGELVKAYTAAARHGGTIRLILPMRIGWPGLVDGTKLLTIFEAFDDEAKAIASFGGDEV